MKQKIYAVYDSKAEFYGQPFFQRTVGEAVRSWETVCNDGQSAMSKFPADYTLFEIGEYDQETGKITPHHVLKSIATGLDAKKTAIEQTALPFPQPRVAQ